MRVNFANVRGEKRSLLLNFSIWYFLFGPFYLLIKKFLLRSVFLIAIYVFALWKEFGVLLADKAVEIGIGEEVADYLRLPSQNYLYSLIAIALFHILMSFIAPRLIAKKLIKKGNVPYSELDTQKLIKHRLASVGTLSYLSSFSPSNGVVGKIVVKNDKELAYHIEQLTSLLKAGMITKDEYNAKRAAILMEKN